MKTISIVLIVLGGLSTLGGIMGTLAGHEPNVAGLTFVVLGLFLLSRANKKQEKEDKKKKWEEGDGKNM